MAWEDFPMITCPHCGKEFQADDYHDISVGDFFDCRYCEKEIFVWQVDTTISADLRTCPEPAP